MKGQTAIVERLNARLGEELAAINQYIVHSEMCANWSYDRLHDAVEKRAIQEMKHAEALIGRILFLEGTPNVSRLDKITIGSDVQAQLRHDLAAEADAVRAYNADIKLAVELGDHGTRELLDSILKDEEAHVDWLEAQLDQVQQMGVPHYLSTQVGSEEG